MSDRIVLTIPRGRPFHPVAHLVLGGLASRLNVTLEALEDLELALDELLGAHSASDEVTLELTVDTGAIGAEIGPFDADRLGAALERDDEGDSVALSRVLAAVVDSVELTDRDDSRWVRLSKRIEPAQEVA